MALPERGALTPPHLSVMPEEVLAALGEPQGWILDGTLGAGGHSALVLERFPDACVIGLDRDPMALEIASQRLEPHGDRARCLLGDYRQAIKHLDEGAIESLAGAMIDLGVSSMQLDRAERGFSINGSGPLDMRFNPAEGGPTAADLVNTLDAAELQRVFQEYGEVRFARTLAERIVARRREHAFSTTADLAAVALEAAPAALRHGRRIHPATLPFQALRIAVNEELAGLPEALAAIAWRLAEGATLAVITFHSLEDRLVKNAFRDLAKRAFRFEEEEILGLPRNAFPLGHLPSRKPLLPTAAECEANPRARSAKLRLLRRGG